MHQEKKTPIETKIDQMLTEARVVLPGAQALLGFQLIAILSDAFERLPRTSQLVHMAAMCATALSVILLIAPAAVHRISFQGADSERFHAIGSALITAAMLPVAAGICLDAYVAVAKATNEAAGAAVAAGAFALLMALWYFYPIALRMRLAPRREGSAAPSGGR